ncbi:hypothetical protein M1589_04605 [Candidatus Marsarchaeota archaeon]|jgi:hypothetical protein|nr:hypothetical protein [Candidatus Marsarchaeota archaeon]MCL5115394.1 hypothetical protein [Candidatus Marsarchaeota archaeon]
MTASTQREVIIGKDRIGTSLKVPGASFSLDELLSDHNGVDHVYFRTHSGNVYMLDRNGRLSSKKNDARGWGTLTLDESDMRGESIKVGERFENSKISTTPVTEIVYVSKEKPGARKITELQRNGSASDITASFERSADTLKQDHELDGPREIGKGGLDIALANIAKHMPKGDADAAKERAKAIIMAYSGQDMNAASVLIYAAERGRFEEYAGKLEENFRKDLGFVAPEARGNPMMPGAVRTNKFLIMCFKEMGIKPTDEKGNAIEEQEERQSPKIPTTPSLGIGEVKAERAEKRFWVAVDDRVKVGFWQNGGKVNIDIYIPATVFSWHDIGGGRMAVQPMSLENEDERAQPFELRPGDHAEPDFREANRLACVGFALHQVSSALEIAAGSGSVDPALLKLVSDRFHDYAIGEGKKIAELNKRFAVDAQFRSALNVIAGGINNMIRIEL